VDSKSYAGTPAIAKRPLLVSEIAEFEASLILTRQDAEGVPGIVQAKLPVFGVEAVMGSQFTPPFNE
jgi:hypothetical protein